jgi:hypothetical protein
MFPTYAQILTAAASLPAVRAIYKQAGMIGNLAFSKVIYKMKLNDLDR